MIQELTSSTFDKEVLASAAPVLVDFWAPACAPCRQLAPVLDELAAEAGGQFSLYKVNAWDEQDLAARYRISSVPTVLIFHRGALVTSLVGFHDKRRLLDALQHATGRPAAV